MKSSEPALISEPRETESAFTLVELLVVIGIIVLLTALAIPAFNAIGGGQNVSSAADIVAGQLDLARQTAMSENRRIELRFWNLPGDSGSPDAWSGLQIYPVSTAAGAPSGSTPLPLGKIQRLPSGVKLIGTEAFSSILGGVNPTGGTDTAGVVANRPYKAVRFRPDGSTELNPDGPGGAINTWTVTIVPNNSTSTATRPADNFATVQIDPVIGRAIVYRP